MEALYDVEVHVGGDKKTKTLCEVGDDTDGEACGLQRDQVGDQEGDKAGDHAGD